MWMWNTAFSSLMGKEVYAIPLFYVNFRLKIAWCHCQAYAKESWVHQKVRRLKYTVEWCTVLQIFKGRKEKAFYGYFVKHLFLMLRLKPPHPRESTSAKSSREAQLLQQVCFDLIIFSSTIIFSSIVISAMPMMRILSRQTSDGGPSPCSEHHGHQDCHPPRSGHGAATTLPGQKQLIKLIERTRNKERLRWSPLWNHIKHDHHDHHDNHLDHGVAQVMKLTVQHDPLPVGFKEISVVKQPGEKLGMIIKGGLRCGDDDNDNYL